MGHGDDVHEQAVFAGDLLPVVFQRVGADDELVLETGSLKVLKHAHTDEGFAKPHHIGDKDTFVVSQQLEPLVHCDTLKLGEWRKFGVPVKDMAVRVGQPVFNQLV